MFEHSYYGSASHIEDMQEEQIAWMSERNGIFFGDEDDEPVEQHEPDEAIEDDEPPMFQRVEHDDGPDEFVLMARAWLG